MGQMQDLMENREKVHREYGRKLLDKVKLVENNFSMQETVIMNIHSLSKQLLGSN
jgi:hypothetical protein